MEEIEFDNDDLVKISVEITTESTIPGQPRYYTIDCWFQVMFKDTDGIFIGRLKKYDRYFHDLELKIEDSKFKTENVKQVHKGEDFCYSDGVTTCDCKGLCRNK